MKKCIKCNIEKDLDEFHLCKKGKEGRKSRCKECVKLETKKHYHNNIDYYKNYRINNLDSIKKIKKIWSENNRERVKSKLSKWKEENKSYIIKYRLDNSEKFKIYNKNYSKNRRNSDPLFKLSGNVRNRLIQYLRLTNIRKKNKTFDVVGCSPSELKNYLEKKFTEGMCWELLGVEIHIDHIIPLSSADNEEEIYKLCHYTNLQPLWAEDNLKKGNK
jgi:AraC-like DNA-binding protein